MQYSREVEEMVCGSINYWCNRNVDMSGFYNEDCFGIISIIQRYHFFGDRNRVVRESDEYYAMCCSIGISNYLLQRNLERSS